jgi:nucleoside-diphosphate-sugar epimerase
MRVFVAGAGGALGSQLVAAGHEVVGMTRTASKQEGLRELGAMRAGRSRAAAGR